MTVYQFEVPAGLACHYAKLDFARTKLMEVLSLYMLFLRSF